MRAGKLRHRIKIEQNTPTADAAGQLRPSWQAVHEDVPAEVLGVAGGERVRGVNVQTTTTHVIRIRYCGDISTEMRVVHDGLAMNITRVADPDGTRREEIIEAST